MTEGTPGTGRGQRAQSGAPASPPEPPAGATPPEEQTETKRFRISGPAFTDKLQVVLPGDKKPTIITTDDNGVEVPASQADALQEAAKSAGVKLKEVTD